MRCNLARGAMRRTGSRVAQNQARRERRVHGVRASMPRLRSITLMPLLGALLIKFDFSLVVLAATFCYFVTFFVMLVLLPPVRVATERRGMWDGVGLALRDRPFMLFNMLLMGYWFMWVQITISLPLIAKDISGRSESVSWVYMLNAGMSVLLQYPLLRLAERWLRPLPILIMGMALMAVGLANVALAHSIPALLLCVACFSAAGRRSVALPSRSRSIA